MFGDFGNADATSLKYLQHQDPIEGFIFGEGGEDLKSEEELREVLCLVSLSLGHSRHQWPSTAKRLKTKLKTHDSIPGCGG